MFDVRCWMFDVGCSMLDVGCSMFDVGCWMFDVRCSMFDVGCSMFRLFPLSALNAHPSPRLRDQRFLNEVKTPTRHRIARRSALGCSVRGVFKNGSRRRAEADFSAENRSASLPRRLRLLRPFLNSPCARSCGPESVLRRPLIGCSIAT